MERIVERILKEAGDLSGAFVWRRVCRDLDGSLNVAVVGRDEAVLERLIEGARAHSGRAHLVDVPVELGEAGETLGLQDRILGMHAVLWATPITQPLSAEERDGLTRLTALGASKRRAVVLADPHLLERMSDDPEAERAEIRQRVDALLPDDWSLTEVEDLEGWLSTAAEAVPQLAREQRARVAALLLGDAQTAAQDAVDQATTELERVEMLLAEEDASLESVRREGDRIAAHMLGTVRRHTEQLLVDLKNFLQHLEEALPAEAEAVTELKTLRQVLPHWLNHVVEQWMRDRLATWRAEVIADLEEVRVSEGELHAELLPPALHPPPMAGDGSWTHRLGTTAALGSGAVLLLLGLWIPGLMALSGGLAWSAMADEGSQVATRGKLVDEAINALRLMGREADRLLKDQVEQLEEDLSELGDEKVEAARSARAGVRTELEERRQFRQNRLRELTALRDHLSDQVEQLELGTSVAS